MTIRRTNQTQGRWYRRVGALAVVAALSGPGVAAAVQNRALPTQTVIDCKQLPKCLECGASSDDGIICCNDPNGCTIVNYPPQFQVPVTPPSPVPPRLGTFRYLAQ